MAAGKDSHTNECVGLDLLKFLRRELARLEQNVIWDPNLAHIVQLCRLLNQFYVILVQSDSATDYGRQLSHSLGMLARTVVA